MAERTLAQNVAQAVADFKAIKDITNQATSGDANIPDGTPTSQYAEKIDATFLKIYQVGEADGKNDGYDNGYQEGYKAGEKEQNSALWDAIQNYGEKTDYNNVFSFTSFSKDTFLPTHDFKPISASGMFCQSRYKGVTVNKENFKDYYVDMVELETKQGIVFDFSSTVNMYRAFASSFFWRLNKIDLSKATDTNYLFYGGYGGHYIEAIEKIISSETTRWKTTAFQYDYSLSHVIFEGVIANTIHLQDSPFLDIESMKSIISCLKDYSGTSNEYIYEVKFRDTCWAALEADSSAPDGNTWQAYVNAKGWNT